VNPFVFRLRQGGVLIVVLPILVGGGYLAFTRLGRRQGGRARTPFIVGGSLLAVLALLVMVRGGGGGGGNAPALPPSVVFTAPLDATTVGRPVEVTMAANHLASGVHLHLMVDAPCVAEGHTIGKDQHHLHLGARETEAVLDLPPGKHTLCLQAGNGAHQVVGSPDRVTIAVR
jgi:hypothetical protein